MAQFNLICLPYFKPIRMVITDLLLAELWLCLKQINLSEVKNSQSVCIFNLKTQSTFLEFSEEEIWCILNDDN